MTRRPCWPRAGRATGWAFAVACVGAALAQVTVPSAVALPDVPPCQVADRVLDTDPDLGVSTLMLDLTWRLPAGFAPRDLVDVAAAGFAGGHQVRAVVVDDLRALREAAADAGLVLAVQSAYRSEAYQARVHEGWRTTLGAERAAQVSARPGHSEHQLGTAIDLRSSDGPPAWELDDWAATPEGAWVAAHAHSFGFVVSYPRDADALACYAYEPWHLRWVGRGVAAAYVMWVADLLGPAGPSSVAPQAVPFRAWLHVHHPPRERAP